MNSYQLVVTDAASQTLIDRTYAAIDVCQGEVCQTQSAPLPEGSYSWTVKGDTIPLPRSHALRRNAQGDTLCREISPPRIDLTQPVGAQGGMSSV